MTALSAQGFAKRFPTVFVTGGAGFIGSHVVHRLVEEGVSVRCLLLPNNRAPSIADLDVTRVTGDITDRETMAQAMRGADLVINLAAIYALWLPRPAKMFEVNVGGARAVMLAARDAGVPRVVHTSSIAAIGYLEGPSVSDEETLFNDWHLDNDYVMSKYVSELEALRHRDADLEVVCVNPAFPFGANDTAPTPTGRLIRDSLSGKVPFVTAGGFNAADVRDVAEGHLLAALHGRSGERYLLGGTNVTFREFSARVAAKVGKKPPRFTAPTGIIMSAARVAKAAADHITHAPPMMTPSSVAYMAGRYLYFSSAKAERELGYTRRTLDDALDASIAWFQGRS